MGETVRRKKLALSGIFVALITAALIFTAGCSTNTVNPTAVEDQSKLDWLNTFLAPTNGVQKTGLPWDLATVDTTISGKFDSKGGKLELKLGDDRVEFQIDKNSVDSPTEIVVRCVKFNAPFGPFWMFDCGPDGTVFNVPIHVKVDGDFGREYTILFYFNEETQLWEYEQVLTPGQVSDGEFDIYHFSKYGISE